MTDVAAAVEAAAETTAASEPADDIEAKAREQGWRPKEDWTGKPENWKDPQTYIEHSDLKTRLTKAEERLARVGKTTEKALENLKRAHEKELASLRAEKRAAVAKGDVKAVDAIDEEIETLKEAGPEKAETETAEREVKAEVVADWQVDNPWFESDEVMTKYAVRISEGLTEENPKISMKENLRRVDEKMRAKFPNYDFGSKKPATKPAGANGHAPVDGGGAFPGLGKKTGKTWNDLPGEAKEVGRLLVKDKTFENEAAYAKEYFKDA